MAEPFPKSRQLARGERRYRRNVASPKQWAAIRAEKLAECRICAVYGSQHFVQTAPLELHHLVSRAQGGDDVADNLVCLCWDHHVLVTSRLVDTLALLAANLTDAEYAYIIGKLGEGGIERLFGVAG
jgi:5-methylcytosine-specific restriction endonuclease McrA